MRKLKLMTLVLFAGLMVAGPAWADEKLDKIEQEITAKWKEVKSMTAKMNMVMDMDQGGMKMKSTMTATSEFLRKGDAMMSRMEGETDVSYEMNGTPQSMKSKMLAISDGEFTHTLTEQMGQKMCMKMKADANNAAGADMLKALREHYDLTVADDEDVDGDNCWVVLGTPKQMQPNAPTKFKYYFQKKTGVAIQWIGYDASDKAMMTTKYTDIKLNEKIDPERFVFKAPEGVQVMDMTTTP